MTPKLKIGTGGAPLTTPAGSGMVGAVKRLSQLGLNHLELEFVQNVFLNPESAVELNSAAKQADVSLSVHGSYYVNLASTEKEKWHAGIGRVVKAAEMGDLAGAVSVTYHSGFIQGDPVGAAQRVIEGTREILNQCRQKSLTIRISPELTGKATQYGDLQQLLDMAKQLRAEGFENIALCIDFAHQYARNTGTHNTYDEFKQTITAVRESLGSKDIDQLHMHVSAIEYGDKGEKNHLLLLNSWEEYQDMGIKIPELEQYYQKLDVKRLAPNKFDWRNLLKAIKSEAVGGYLVCESPVLELDALVLKHYYHSL